MDGQGGVRGGMAGLPPRTTKPATTAGSQSTQLATNAGVQKPGYVQRLRRSLIQAAVRMGFPEQHEILTQFLMAIDRAERMMGASPGAPVTASDGMMAEVRKLEKDADPNSRLGVTVKVLLIGMTGTGKTELIHNVMGRKSSITAFRGATSRVRVYSANIKGIDFKFIDTPGLYASSNKVAENKAALKSIRAAHKWHKPSFVLYVDRLDASRPSLGEMSVLGQITDTLGAAIWRNCMVVLTHANAARAVYGPQYDTIAMQKARIISQLLRQVSGDQQTRNQVMLVDCHPDSPKNASGQAVIMNGPTAVPWLQDMLLRLIAYKVYNDIVSHLKASSKKTAAAPAANPADAFGRMMRSRLPPLSFFSEQLTEGVLKPEGWATLDDPVEEVTEDEEAEGFLHVYHNIMADLAKENDPWAQREYAAAVRKLARSCKSVQAAEGESVLETQLEAGLEGNVTEPIDFGPTFDPEDLYSHRHCFPENSGDVQIIPSQDYYGPEHGDPLNGLVMQMDGQPFNTNGWGGVPYSLSVCVEKDKNNFCLQGETHFSLVHSVPPFGSRHITQVCGSWEMLRPNIKDVMYQLEVNTFKDGLLAANDHAGCGLMLARLGEGGNITKGPVAMGLRLQETFGVGPLQVQACASRLQVEGPTGGKDEGWAARTFIHNQWLPGLGLAVDFFQEKTVEESGKRTRGYAVNATYDWVGMGAAWDLEVDHAVGSDQLYVGLNIFSGNDYKLLWLLAVPMYNYVVAKVQGLLGQGQEGGEQVEEEAEEEDMALLNEGI